jgi:hypothetical protein
LGSSAGFALCGFFGVAYLAEQRGPKIRLRLEHGCFGEKSRHLHILEHYTRAGLASNDVRFDTRSLLVRDLIVNELGNQDLYLVAVT